MDKMLREIGNKIKKCRITKGISQEELAERTGLSSSYIYKIEAGNIHLTVRTLLIIAEVLDIPAFEIMQVEVKTKADQRIILLLEKYTEREYEFIYYMLNQYEQAKALILQEP